MRLKRKKKVEKCVHGRLLSGKCDYCAASYLAHADGAHPSHISADDLPRNEPKAVYNPRRMQWERPDGSSMAPQPVKVRDRVFDLYKRIPFGKYGPKPHNGFKGDYLVDIPADYLEWVLANTDAMIFPGLHESIEFELNQRHGGPEREFLDPYEQDRFDIG